jgi:hypothetical protein
MNNASDATANDYVWEDIRSGKDNEEIPQVNPKLKQKRKLT